MNTKLLFKSFKILILAVFWPTSASAIFSGNNFNFAYDDNILYSYWKTDPCKEAKEPQSKGSFKTGLNFEYGFGGKGKNSNYKTVDIAQIYGPVESYIHSMDYSTDPEVLTTELEKFLHPPLILTDSTGHILEYSLNTKKEEWDLNFWTSVSVPSKEYGEFGVSVYFPLKIVNISNVSAKLTPLPEDLQAILDNLPELKTELSNLPKLTDHNLGGLKLGSWSNDRPWGDLHFILSWNKTLSYKHWNNSWFNIFTQIGITAPTADPQDQQNVFSIPRGNDNALGVPFSISLNAFFKNQIRVGACADFLFSTKEKSYRRLKRTVDQTERLIADKVKAERDPGMVYRFTGLLELKTESRIFSGLLAWQVVYKEKDKFSDFSNSEYSRTIVNQSERWQKKIVYNVIAKAGIDFKVLTKSENAPKLSVSYKLPITGKRVELFHSIGLNLSMNF